MNDLITIQDTNINDGLVKTVSARDVHDFLDIKKDFSTWTKVQLKAGEFEQDVDFATFPLKGENVFSKKRIEYSLTLDTAKHICLMSRTPKGKKLRKYFIEVEKKATANTAPTLSPEEQVLIGYQAALSQIESLKQEAVEAKPKVHFYDKHVEHEGNYNLRTAGKMVTGKPQKFIDDLKGKYVFYENKALVPYVQYLRTGIFATKVTVVDEKERVQTYVTPKGIRYFTEKYADRSICDAGLAVV